MNNDLLNQVSSIIQIGTPLVFVFLGYLVNKLRVENAERDMLRLKEDSVFKIDIQRQLSTLSSIDKSVETVRSRQHEMTNKLTTVELIASQLVQIERRVQSVETRVEDKARRMTVIETKTSEISSSISVLSDRIASLESYIRSGGMGHRHNQNEPRQPR